MNRITVRVAVIYGLWVLLNVAVTLFSIGDGGVSSHLTLLFTGFPLALASLAVKHATLSAVLFAGVLGLLQWSALAWAYVKYSHRAARRNDA